MANINYLLLGTNLGNRQENLHTAAIQLSEVVGQVSQRSSIYETQSWGVNDQPSYLNQVLQVKTILTPEDLLKKINWIEQEMGRQRRIRWESRIIDIDILYYNDLVLQTSLLTIPHPQIANRRFTLVPLTEIAPEFIHPVLKVSNSELLEQCADNLLVIPVIE